MPSPFPVGFFLIVGEWPLTAEPKPSLTPASVRKRPPRFVAYNQPFIVGRTGRLFLDGATCCQDYNRHVGVVFSRVRS
jgi:hypothetical protein